MSPDRPPGIPDKPVREALLRAVRGAVREAMWESMHRPLREALNEAVLRAVDEVMWRGMSMPLREEVRREPR